MPPLLSLRRAESGSSTEHEEQVITGAPVTSSASPADEVPGDTRLSRAILVAVLCGFLVVEAINVTTPPSRLRGATLAAAWASIVLVFALQLRNSSPNARRWPAWRRVLHLLAQALVTYLPLLFLGREWGGMAGFLAGSVLLLVPGWVGWTLFIAIAGSMLVWPLATGMSPEIIAYTAVATIDTGLVVFGLSRLSLVVKHLHATRGELAQLAIGNERMRFARDLHHIKGRADQAAVGEQLGARPCRARRRS